MIFVDHVPSRRSFVGLEQNVKKLVDYLVKEDSSQVVSITGMGGIGKTTLAREVYNHETVQSHYHRICMGMYLTAVYKGICVADDLAET